MIRSLLTIWTAPRVDRCWSYSWLLNTFKDLLHDCLTLEELDLTGFTGQLDVEVFKHLGKTLTTIRLHEDEDCSGLCRRRVLSNTEIEDIGRYCPGLRRLGLDVAYNGSWVSLAWPSSRRQDARFAISSPLTHWIYLQGHFGSSRILN